MCHWIAAGSRCDSKEDNDKNVATVLYAVGVLVVACVLS